jgi:hypothetical protein
VGQFRNFGADIRVRGRGWALRALNRVAGPAGKIYDKLKSNFLKKTFANPLREPPEGLSVGYSGQKSLF